MLEILTGFIIQLIQSSGYFGMGSLMVLNSVGIPIPSEIILPFSGFLANLGSFSLPLVILAAIIGDLIGSILGYTIGYFLEENLFLNLIKKYGKFVLITEHDYLRTTNWIKKYGIIVVFVGKMLPGIKSFIALAAGVSEIKFHKFLIGNILASLIYCSLVTYLGFFLGSQWGSIGGYFRKFELVILIALILVIVFYINYKLKIFKLGK